MSRERRISKLFVRLADTLVNDYDLLDFLHVLAVGAKEVLAVDAVGVMLAADGDQLGLSAASDEAAHVLEFFELQTETGPCYTAFSSAEQILVDDLEACQDRWPDFVPLAVARGFRSALAFPLRLRGDTIGALNAFRQQVGAFPEDDAHLGQSLADVATIGILQERAVSAAEHRAVQLQHALSSRVLIEQAKGRLVERLDVDAQEAFERLRNHARNHNERLRDVCQRVVEGELSLD